MIQKFLKLYSAPRVRRVFQKIIGFEIIYENRYLNFYNGLTIKTKNMQSNLELHICCEQFPFVIKYRVKIFEQLLCLLLN